jgi:hypothetical protein
MTAPSNANTNGLWAITSYFNPIGYRRRLPNFKVFRERLEVPLVAVELSYGSAFELQENDADILIQLRGNAVLWQKERLLNLALQALPDSCRKVAWIDCDIFFGSANWVESANRLLDRFALIQMFKRAHYLSPHWTAVKNYASEVEVTRPSFAYSVSSGLTPTACLAGTFDLRDNTTCTNGIAWAARRALLDKHGFFDACIIGGGDTAMGGAATHCADDVIKSHYMNERQQDRYVAWARPFYESVRSEIGYLDVDLFHLWHGDVEDRRARARHEGLQQFQFDPFVDIAVDTNGCWRWNSDKRELHDYVRGYFSSRREDG